MSSRSPSGSYTGIARAPVVGVVGVPVQKLSDRAAFCGCCCTIHRRALLFVLAIFYLAIAVLSGVSVGAGVNANMTHYNGQVQVNATTYTITPVNKAADLRIWTGWLRYTGGTSATSAQNLTALSDAAGVLGFILAFVLLCSLVMSAWKFMSIMCCGGRFASRNAICPGILLCILLLAFLLSFYGVTSHDLDNFAHQQLGVSSSNDLAMVPDYAWYSGFFAAILWIFVSIFTIGLPTDAESEYHQF